MLYMHVRKTLIKYHFVPLVKEIAYLVPFEEELADHFSGIQGQHSDECHFSTQDADFALTSQIPPSHLSTMNQLTSDNAQIMFLQGTRFVSPTSLYIYECQNYCQCDT